MGTLGETEDDGVRGRRDQESTHAKKDASTLVLNRRYYLNILGI